MASENTGVPVWRWRLLQDDWHYMDTLSRMVQEDDCEPGMWLPTDPASQEKRQEAVARALEAADANPAAGSVAFVQPTYEQLADAVLCAIFGDSDA